MTMTDAAPLAVSRDYSSGLVHVPGPARDAAGREALDPRVRRKLERLELDADTAHALLMTLSERVRAADEERRQAEGRREFARTNPADQRGTWVSDPSAGPHARTWRPARGETAPELDADVARLADDLSRLTAARDAAQDRWRNLAQVAERARAYLGLAK